jgi:hypothetical protein
MAHCVFMHKADSISDDIPAERYQFPAICLLAPSNAGRGASAPLGFLA